MTVDEYAENVQTVMKLNGSYRLPPGFLREAHQTVLHVALNKLRAEKKIKLVGHTKNGSEYWENWVLA